jgi:hypothetical protein
MFTPNPYTAYIQNIPDECKDYNDRQMKCCVKKLCGLCEMNFTIHYDTDRLS